MRIDIGFRELGFRSQSLFGGGHAKVSGKFSSTWAGGHGDSYAVCLFLGIPTEQFISRGNSKS